MASQKKTHMMRISFKKVELGSSVEVSVNAGDN